MKLLLVTESYWPNADGGAEFERRLAHGLADKNHEVIVWAPGRENYDFSQTDGKTKIEREKAATLLFNKKYKVSYFPWLRAQKLIKKYRPDILHIHNFYFMGLAALLWAKYYRIPIVATNHFMPENLFLNVKLPGFLEPLTNKIVWQYLVFLHNRCDYVTSPTKTAIRLLSDRGLKVPNKAVTNGVDYTRFAKKIPKNKLAQTAKKYKIDYQRQTLLYLGRLDGEKRLDIIIDAMPAIIAKHPEAQLVLAGSGTARKRLERQVSHLGLSENVYFAGYIDEKDKAAIYHLGEIFVISSPAELQSIVTLEAMSSGLALLSVDAAALCELCRSGENGYLFQLKNKQSLVKFASKMLENPETIRAMGQKSRKMVEDAHTNSVMISCYESIIVKTIKK